MAAGKLNNGLAFEFAVMYAATSRIEVRDAEQEEAFKVTLAKAGINKGEYTSVCLSADRTRYEVTLLDGTVQFISSGFEYFED